MIKENPLGTENLGKLILKYSIPGIISQLINSTHNIVDQIFIGWGINDLGIAATNIVFPFTTITTAFSALIGMGAAAKFSILLGKNRNSEAADYLGSAVVMTLIAGIITAIAGLLFLEPILYFFGATDLIMPYAFPYAKVICIGIPFGIFSAGMSYFIRADGSPAYASGMLVAGAVANIILDPIFLFIFGMDIKGVALATILGQILSALFAVIYITRKLRTIELKDATFKAGPDKIKTVFSLGLATFTQHVLATAAQIVQMNALRYYGSLSIYGSEAAIGAAGAVGKLTIVFMSGIIGIAIGCQPIVGYNLGNKKYARVKGTYLRALLYGSIIAVCSFLIMQIFPDQMLSIFGSEDPMFSEFGHRYIRIFLFCMFINALQPVTSIFCTAIGKAKSGFWMALIRQGILLIPMLIVLPRFMGIDGILFSGMLSDGLAAVVVIFIGRRQVRMLTEKERKMSI